MSEETKPNHMAPGPSDGGSSDSSDGGGTKPNHMAPGPSDGGSSDGGAKPQAPIPARVADGDYLKKLHDRQDKRNRERRPRMVLYCVLGALGVVLALFIVSGIGVMVDANSIVGSAKAIPGAMLSGDAETINSSVKSVKGHSANMNFVVNTPIWNLGCVLPGVGQDFKNIQQLSAILSDVGDDVLDPLASDSSQLSGNDVMSEDQIDVGALLKVAQIVQNLTPAMQGIADQASGLQRGMIPQVNDAVAMVKTYTSQFNELSDTLGDMVSVLPGLLGADGTPKSYLLIAQNSAELRPTGGIPGAWGLVTVDNGKIKIGDFGHPDNVSRSSTPAIHLTQDDLNIMGDYYPYMKPDIFWVSSNFDPDFSHSAQHFETYWKLLVEQGITGSSQPDLPENVDGVVAMNPIFVQRLLGLTSGYDVDGKHVDGTNAAKVMLSDAYWDLSPDQQDGYFSQVASGAISTIMGNVTHMDTSGLLSVLQDAIRRGDLVMYFNDPSVQKVVEDLDADGRVPDDKTTPELGTYFYDITWSKMDWYLNSNTSIGDATQNADGSTSYQVTTTLINEMTDDEAKTAPDYVVSFGDNPLVAHRGGMATVIYLYAPAGGTISNLSCNSGQFSKTTAEGHELYHGMVVLDPQRKETITYTVTTSPDATSQLTVHSTPTLVDVAGWRQDGKDDSEFEAEDGTAYGSVSSTDQQTDQSQIDNLLSNSATSGRKSSNTATTSMSSLASSNASSSSSSRNRTRSYANSGDGGDDGYTGYSGSSSSGGSGSYDSDDDDGSSSGSGSISSRSYSGGSGSGGSSSGSSGGYVESESADGGSYASSESE